MAAPWDKESLCEAIKRDPEFCVKCPSLVTDIASRRLELVKLVEYLKEFLTDPEPSQRAVGTLVLSSVLNDLPIDFLREDEVRFLVAFFCDRLKDHHDVIPSALKGILSLLKVKNISKELPAQILNTLMLNINCQSQRQEDRLTIYRILDLLVIPHLEGLKGLGPDLVYHVISAIDGERDPRNLKFLFSMLPTILRGLSLGHLTEDCFEVVACYFPVDFKPAAADQIQLTREDLAFALADCLTAVPAFTEFCIPLLLEKLDSPLRLAKLDSLYLLKKGCQLFPAEDIAVHIAPLWMSLSREALSGPDNDVRQAAREAVTQLLKCLSDMPIVNNSQQSDPMRQLLNDLISAATSALNEVQTSLFIPASDLLLAAAKSGPTACEHILKKVMPLLLELFSGKSEAAERSVYLSLISKFLSLCKSEGVIHQDNETEPDVTKHWHHLVQIYISATEHEASVVRREALHGLSILVSLLNASERSKLYELLSFLVDQENVSDVREQCILCLREVGSEFASEVSTYLLSEKLKFDGIQSSDPKFERRLEAQCCLAALQPFAQEVLPKIINLAILSEDRHQIHVTLASLRKLLDSLEDVSAHVYESLHRHSLVTSFLNWWISNLESDWVNDETILNELCLIICDVTRNLSQEEQALLVQQTLHYFYPGSDSFKPFEISSPKHHLLTVTLLEAVLGNLYCNVLVPEVYELCSALTNLAINSPHSYPTIAAGRLCASLLNKMPDTLLDQTLQDISSRLEVALTQTEELNAGQAAALHGWIIKGLAMRGYRGLEEWIDKLVNILGNNRQSVAVSAAQAFQVIMKDSSTFLNHQSHCTFRLLYKQRVFISSLKLVKASRQASERDRIAYLLALTHLLSGVPQTVLANYLGEVLPLLLASLSQDSPTLLEAALNTLHGLLGQSVYSESLKDHIQTMVPRLIPLASYQNSMKVRTYSLSCLSEICSLPTQMVLPFKDEVVSSLEVCLDDPKRLVRKDAVKARSRWIMLAAPGGKQ